MGELGESQASCGLRPDKQLVSSRGPKEKLLNTISQVTAWPRELEAELAPWACELRSHTGPQAQKSPVTVSEVFLTLNEGPCVFAVREPHTLCSQS